MTIPQQLRTILRLSKLSQTALAAELGVTFVAFNRWLHGKAVPRRGAQERIVTLYRSYTGLTVLPEEDVDAKKALLLRRVAKHGDVLQTILKRKDILDQCLLTLTYTTNFIEGSTLTEAETQAVLFHDAILPDKSLTEHLEAKNHQAALLYLFDHLSSKKQLNEVLLLRLHGMLMNGIHPDAGSYRRHAVRIVGANIPTANYLKVPGLMEELCTQFTVASGDDIIKHAASVHATFEQIHPFSDGNGRIGRLLLHAMLLQQSFPPAVIRPKQKRLYYAYLNAAQQSQDTTLLEDFLCDAILDGWDLVA